MCKRESCDIFFLFSLDKLHEDNCLAQITNTCEIAHLLTAIVTGEETEGGGMHQRRKSNSVRREMILKLIVLPFGQIDWLHTSRFVLIVFRCSLQPSCLQMKN